jgi:hypothetical protein
VLGLLIWLRQPKHVSRLQDVDALRLARENLDHLVGRRDDVELLANKCQRSRLVFLIGESGSGKSALVLAGLIPKLHAEKSLLPLVIRNWGSDWERDPVRGVATELKQRVGSEALTDVKILDLPETPEQLADLLIPVWRTTGRMPLLIFDQFDDYQTEHRSRFLVHKTWISANELKKENAFWRTVSSLLEGDYINVLFITRSDTFRDSVRFIDSVTQQVDRLPKAAVQTVIERLTAAGAIRDPDDSWDHLRDRLIRDLLDRDERILPQQLRVALLGLQDLPLTVSDYERVGGITGLEARFIRSHITSTSISTGLA